MDPRDAIRDARIRLKKLAARAEATAEKLREEQARLKKEIVSLEAENAGPIIDELRMRLAAIELDIGAAIQQREEAERESKEIQGLVPELERAEVQRLARSAMGPALDERSAADVALENVRHHVDQLEAEASLGVIAPTEASSPRAPQTPADPRAQLEALKAARGKKAEVAPAADEPSTAPPPKPKRTM